ncbi:hypothetical protein CGRA01v4_03819 [Colletotrichum graminicola]|nr:hypothetical protein CGRA01v4_03819 [Colletotrichum graminicola]
MKRWGQAETRSGGGRHRRSQQAGGQGKGRDTGKRVVPNGPMAQFLQLHQLLPS